MKRVRFEKQPAEGPTAAAAATASADSAVGKREVPEEEVSVFVSLPAEHAASVAGDDVLAYYYYYYCTSTSESSISIWSQINYVIPCPPYYNKLYLVSDS